MLSLYRASRHAFSYSRQRVRHIADLGPFQPGDQVILRPKNDRSAAPRLTPPLNPAHRLDTHKGAIAHNDILGKRVRDTVRSNKGVDYRIHDVKLEEYVRLTKRLVTPLYPQDAQLIVGLLDLHPEPPVWGQSSNEEPKLEILEAGTGHGALTLYLSRAIHAANLPFPHRSAKPEHNEDEESSIDLAGWKRSRRALIHTIERSPQYSTHAQNNVRNFRRGLYAHNVDFHIGDVSEWTLAALSARQNEPFLSHAFLDLPGAETHLATVASALRTDGSLIVFNPSITQILEAAKEVKAGKLLLELERVIELGVNGGTGGREWDIRAVRPRAVVKKAAQVEGVEGEGVAVVSEDSGVELDRDEEQDTVQTKEADDWKWVCRPKVGELVVGGGFLAVFKKQREKRIAAE